MSNNILLKSANAIFEPHILSNKKLPFIYHKNVISSRGILNVHENLELLYFTSGSGNVKYDGRTLPVKEGDVVVVNSYITHQVVSDGNIAYVCLIIDNSFCKYNNIDVTRLLFTPLIQDEFLNEQFARVISEYAEHREFEAAGIKCAVLDLLLYLCRNYASPRTEPLLTTDSATEYIRRSIEYIKTNLDKKLTADSVAASAGLSKYYFLREFKKITGYTLTNYINIIRCEQAKELLSIGGHKVKEVAFLCGFENYSYFTNVFKKYTGSLPSDYINHNYRPCR